MLCHQIMLFLFIYQCVLTPKIVHIDKYVFQYRDHNEQEIRNTNVTYLSQVYVYPQAGLAQIRVGNIGTCHFKILLFQGQQMLILPSALFSLELALFKRRIENRLQCIQLYYYDTRIPEDKQYQQQFLLLLSIPH